MNPASILIVEDDGVLATHLHETLKEMGYAIPAVIATGEDAIARARDLLPNVVLMDIRLRGRMSGTEAAREIHQSLGIPVIYLTAFADEGLVGQAKAAEPYAYLTKPVRDAELQASIEIALYKSAAERRIQHLNDVLRSVRDVNQLITREQDRPRLLEQACQIIMRTRGYRLAYIAATDPTGHGQAIQARAGRASDLVDLMASVTDSAQRTQWLWMRAWAERQPVMVEDLSSDTTSGLWRDAALARGIASEAALPMIHAGRLYGVLGVAADQPAAFDSEELTLLAELAGDLALALHSLQGQSERLQAERDKEKLQAQLAQAQKMESVGRLAGGVAHDFNNMLQAILGNAALILEGVPADSPWRGGLEEIQKSAERSADLTRQLLAFARKQTIQPRVLDLNDTVGGMLKMLRRLIGEDLHLAWMPGGNLWPVKVDPSQIDQILANLCVNARDAVAGPGQVTIRTFNLTLDDTSAEKPPNVVPGNYVVLSVSDTGHGMDEETRAHLFEPFFTTKEVGKGTGLGLATVFGIVEQNRGWITVDTQPERGTTFKIFLPRTQADPVTEEPNLFCRLPRGAETVLLVEDEEQILTVAQCILEQQGYTVLAAPSPLLALALAAAHAGPIHLLITDVVMPAMNGRQLRDQMRARYPDLKCLFISGYTADLIARHGVLDEGVDFLQKPFSIQTLGEKVRAVLDAPHCTLC